MRVIRETVSVAELREMSTKMFGGIVKAVVDVEQEIMAIDAEMHVDEEALLLDSYESQQKNLWGINLAPTHFGTDEFIVFDSMINIRPSQGNMSRSVDNVHIQKRIREIVCKRVSQ